jgi:hypothetical protein
MSAREMNRPLCLYSVCWDFFFASILVSGLLVSGLFHFFLIIMYTSIRALQPRAYLARAMFTRLCSVSQHRPCMSPATAATTTSVSAAAAVTKKHQMRQFSSSSTVSSSSASMSVLNESPYDMVSRMNNAGIHRAYVVRKADGSIVASHELFEPVAEYCRQDQRDYNKHAGLFFEVSPTTNSLLSAAVHIPNRGSGAGGVRLWPYDTLQDFVVDGIRLSLGMYGFFFFFFLTLYLLYRQCVGTCDTDE